MADPRKGRLYEFGLHMPAEPTGATTPSDASIARPAMPVQVDPAPLIKCIVDDILAGVDRRSISGAFHHSVANMIVKVADILRIGTGIRKIALSGGVFQNVLLTTIVTESLLGSGFEVYTQQLVPCNDGGLSLGQAYVVALASRSHSGKAATTGEMCV